MRIACDIIIIIITTITITTNIIVIQYNTKINESCTIQWKTSLI
jgi:hypothetical protein